MALAKRPLAKEENIDPTMKNDEHDGNGNNKRKKRSNRDDEQLKDERSCSNNSLPQKKRSFIPITGPCGGGLGGVGGGIGRTKQNPDDQDDETLIRETQAALKSLSGSWPDSRGSLYKINDQDENPPFQNLFEEKHHDLKLSPSASSGHHHQISVDGSGSGSGVMIDSQCNIKDVITLRECNGKIIKNDLKMLQKFRKDKDEFKIDPLRLASSQHYQSPDFNELVDDSSNDLEIDMSENGDKDNQHYIKLKKDILRRNRELHHKDDMYLNFPQSQNKVPFSQTSAFKPPTDIRKNGTIGLVGPYAAEATFVGYPEEPQSSMDQSIPIPIPIPTYQVEEKLPIKIKVEESTKSVGSPDSKQYTILQPAGVGSRAASVMQDIAREGVVSVSAVSSSSSPGIGIVSSSTMAHIADKIHYDRPMPALSPGSINRGELIKNSFVLFF